jgi:hypothetical protein
MPTHVTMEQKNPLGQQTTALDVSYWFQLGFKYFSVWCNSNNSGLLKGMFQCQPITVPEQDQHHFTCRCLGFELFVFGDVECFHSLLCHLDVVHNDGPMFHHLWQFVATDSLLLGCVCTRNAQISINGSVFLHLLLWYPSCTNIVAAKVTVDDDKCWSITNGHS